MYLPRSSRWSMTRRRKRPNLFGWTLFGLVVLFGYYFNQVYLPSQPNPFDATPTVTRSPESFVTEAESFFKEGKLPQSIDAYQSAINASPQNPTLYIALARIQMWAGKYEDAQANAENAILLSPENSMAHAVRAWALDFQGKNSDAIDEINKAIELDSNNAIAHAYRVEILIDSGLFDNIEKAREVSRTALALDPNALETRRARGYIFEVTGDYPSAIQFYKSAIEVNPNIPILHLELGRNLRFVGVYDEAIDEFTHANTLNPADPQPELLISRTYATEGEYTKALQYAKAATEDKPSDPALRGNYGVMYFRNFQYQEAVNQLSLSINGGKTENGLPIIGLPLTNELRIAEYYYTYGLALARTNQCGQALPIAQKLQSAFPTEPSIQEAATAINQICEENLNNPVTTTPVPSTIEETAVVESEIPVETETPLTTPTP
jgi:tetratricopeptide (TPR) repeat protein